MVVVNGGTKCEHKNGATILAHLINKYGVLFYCLSALSDSPGVGVIIRTQCNGTESSDALQEPRAIRAGRYKLLAVTSSVMPRRGFAHVQSRPRDGRHSSQLSAEIHALGMLK